jgi:DNA/RNA-binding domain of Phe-tRNA-synthetase-like protein
MEAGPVSPPELESELATGRIADEVAEEFPALRLRYLELDARPGRSSRGVKQRLRDMSSRFRGPQAVAMRQEPIPWAYRVFYRHIGLDPDADRTPVEEAAVQRLIQGAFRSHNRVDDALLIALVETGVPIWALDAAAVERPLGIRVTGTAERLGRDPRAPALVSGQLVVADERSPLAVLFGDLAPGHGVTKETSRMLLFTIQVQGVPEIHVEEAVYSCVEVLTEV